MLTKDKPHPSPLPAAEADMFVHLFQEQHQQTTCQFQLLVDKIGAATKHPHVLLPIHSDKSWPGDWHHRFNVCYICTIQGLIDCNNLEAVQLGLEDLQQLLQQRNFNLDQNDAYPGYLNFKDEQAKLNKQKDEGIDKTLLHSRSSVPLPVCQWFVSRGKASPFSTAALGVCKDPVPSVACDLLNCQSLDSCHPLLMLL
uniref:Uncharacterized protein n=1 Tax=Plectus sambesii TaxID=2011161 RepID=A0A914WGG7_9BILA